MTASILQVRKLLGRDDWRAPMPYGPSGWVMVSRSGQASVIVSTAPGPDGVEWTHASMTGPGRTPTYDEMCQLHRAVWGGTGYSYEIHPPDNQHVNIHPHALHLWGRADGRPILPEFGAWGSI